MSPNPLRACHPTLCMIRDVIMRDEGQCAFFKGDYNFPMSPRLHGLRESRCLHFVQKSGVQIAFAFKCACLLTCILVESATCALGQSTAVPELKSLYESHQWFSLRDASKRAPLPAFYRGAVDAVFNDVPSARKHLEAVLGGIRGIRDLALVDSALARPRNLLVDGKPHAAALAACNRYGLRFSSRILIR